MENKELDILIENLKQKGFSYSDIFKLMQKKEVNSIPIEIFKNRKLGMLEAVCIYLKDEKNLTYNEIAKLLNRDDRTIWTSYKKAKKKINNDKQK